MIWFKNIFCYAGWESLHISIALVKFSGLNVFICIACGRRRTQKTLSNKNVRSKHYDRLPCLPVKYVFAYLCTPCLCRHDTHQRVPSRMKCTVIVIFCTLYFNVMSPVYETWGYLWSAWYVHVFWGRCGFAEWLCWEGGKLAFKANLLLLAFPKSPTLPLRWKKQTWLL